MSSEPDVSISDTMQRQLLLGELDTEDGSSSESEDSFPTTLNEFGYKFNDKGELVSTVDSLSRFNFNVKEGNHAYNQKHYEALGEVVTEHIYQIMENELAMQRHFIPVYSSDVARSFFFMTSGALSKQKLMVLIHGSGVVRAGQWSRRLIINEDLDQGSQLPYIRRAVQDDFGVIVLNTNVNELNETPDYHGIYVWKTFVECSSADSIVIVAHSFGGVVACCVADLFYTDFQKRVFAMVFTDSVHSVRCHGSSLHSLLRERAVNYVSSSHPLGYVFPATPRFDCSIVSAGTNVHERTSYSCFECAFRFIAVKYTAWQQRQLHALSSGEQFPCKEDVLQSCDNSDSDSSSSDDDPNSHPQAISGKDDDSVTVSDLENHSQSTVLSVEKPCVKKCGDGDTHDDTHDDTSNGGCLGDDDASKSDSP